MLSSRTKRAIRWVSSEIVSDHSVILTFDSIADASDILRQRDLALGGLRLVATLRPNIRVTPPQQQTLLQYVGSKFQHHPAAMLDLGGALQALTPHIPEADFNDKGFVDAICEIIAGNCRQVTSVRLDGNSIRSLAAFDGLFDAAPMLVNLSLADNKLESVDELDFLSGYAGQLGEIVLSGNPLPTMSAAIQSHLVKMKFTSLRLINGIPAQQLIQFGVQRAVTKLPHLMGSSFEPPQIEPLARSIIVKFFESHGDALYQFYADGAHFSLTVDDVGLRSRYTPSRNLAKLSGWGARQQALKRGKVDVAAALKALPTMHYMLSTFIADVTALSEQVLVIIVNGQFQETAGSSSSTRDFTRVLTMTLTPGGWLIANDHLHVSIAAEDRSKAPLPPSQLMVVQLAQHSRCDPESAYHALVAGAGNPETALRLIQSGAFPARVQ
ncbi:hypothetical protein PBRA_008620 [Plasmodiophora brassicae]|nr:hypothetical protein PBRA_008620 [Plasmodiophora brassicae]